MKAKTLLLKPWEVKAILGGATIFARPAKGVPAQPKTNCHPDHKQKHPQPYLDSYCGERKTDINPRGMSEFWNWWQVDDRQCLPQFKCPYGQPGTRIIGKETWYARRSEPIVVEGCAVASGGPTEIYYSADDPEKHGGCWRSPATMPAWAARIHLEVVSVECRRIQSVTGDEAKACGADCRTDLAWNGTTDRSDFWNSGNIAGMRELINESYPGAWDRNDWFWLVSFKRIELGN